MCDMKLLNPKKQVMDLFQKAIKDEKFLTVLEDKGQCLCYYDEENDYERRYYFDDTIESISNRIFMDSQVVTFLPKDAFAQFLFEKIDPNALMVMEKIVLVWDDEEGMSPIRDALEDEYGDQKAQFMATGDLIGQLWTDRQIPFINVSSIYESCCEIYMEEVDGPFNRFFATIILQTIVHECRHLFYDCNEIVMRGEGTAYPKNGYEEQFVERYGNSYARKNLSTFYEIIIQQGIENLK